MCGNGEIWSQGLFLTSSKYKPSDPYLNLNKDKQLSLLFPYYVRKRRDLNSRTGYPVAWFRIRCLQPLSHVSNVYDFNILLVKKYNIAILILNKVMKENIQKYNIIQANPLKTKWSDILKISSVPVFLASLCCLSPIILLSVGLVSLSVATELADVFYGKYKWLFRFVGFVALIIAFVFYLRRRGVCTLDDVKKRRNELINKFLLVIITGVLGYVFFLYVVVHYLGVWLNVWK